MTLSACPMRVVFKHIDFMKTLLIPFLLVGSFGAVAQSASTSPVVDSKPKEEVAAPPVVKKWTCTAQGLAEFRYDGSDWARIRLAAYSSGGSYKVTKDKTGDIATGVTADRTPFVCTNQ